MLFADINGVTIHYRLAGTNEGRPVVLINSLGTDARIWDGAIRLLESSYRILSYDKRGHGLSDIPEGPYRLEDHAADLFGLLDHLGMGDCALVGVSVGGMIAQLAACQQPRRIKALVLCDTAPKIGTAEYWNERIEAVRATGMAPLADMIVERWFSPEFRRTRPAELGGWRNMILRADRRGYAATCAAIRDADLTDRVRSLSAPTLVACGEFDLATPPSLVRTTADLIPGAEYELIENAGHLPSIERPQFLAALIDRHLGKWLF